MRTAAKAWDEQSLQSRLSQGWENTVAEASAPATTAAKKAHTRKTGTVKQVTTPQGDDAGTAREIPVKPSRVPKPKQPRGKKTAVMMQPTTEEGENLRHEAPSSKEPSSTAVSKRRKGGSRKAPVESHMDAEAAEEDPDANAKAAPSTKAPSKTRKRRRTAEAKGKGKERIENPSSEPNESVWRHSRARASDLR